MVQVGNNSERSSSPFWRNRPQVQRQASSRSNKVIGASYSHADMLKFDSLSIGALSRPQTPPPSSSARASPTPPANRQQYQSPERKPYSNLNSSSLSSWDVIDGPDDDDEDDFMYDDDEDEFGLPSLDSMRKRRLAKEQRNDLSREPLRIWRLHLLLHICGRTALTLLKNGIRWLILVLRRAKARSCGRNTRNS